MTGWRPIETYDARKYQRVMVIFYFPREQSGRSWLPRMIREEHAAGRRVATYWMPLPEPEA